MAQKSQIIDITKSYLPGDPETFPMNLVSTEREDGEEQVVPVAPYDAKNVLPTAYGYRSYFGISSTINVNTLTGIDCDEILLFQTDQFENILVALCSDGVRYVQGSDVAWTLLVDADVPDTTLTDDWNISGIYRQYTWCMIENDLYIYRQGHTSIFKLDFSGTWTAFQPSFLVMAGQMGIFKANGRLGMWDSLNSVSWSDAIDLTDFTPSIETLAGNTIFLGVKGRIVTIKQHGEGFVIYATSSIVGVSYTTTGAMIWDPMVLTQLGGVAYPRSVCIGTSDKEHFAYTNMGIFSIGHFNALSRQYDYKNLVPEFFDYLKETRDPVYLECFGARYLHFLIMNPGTLGGTLSFNTNRIGSFLLTDYTLSEQFTSTAYTGTLVEYHIDAVGNNSASPSVGAFTPNPLGLQIPLGMGLIYGGVMVATPANVVPLLDLLLSDQDWTWEFDFLEDPQAGAQYVGKTYSIYPVNIVAGTGNVTFIIRLDRTYLGPTAALGSNQLVVNIVVGGVTILSYTWALPDSVNGQSIDFRLSKDGNTFTSTFTPGGGTTSTRTDTAAAAIPAGPYSCSTAEFTRVQAPTFTLPNVKLLWMTSSTLRSSDQSFTYNFPITDITLQAGSPTPGYPTIYGSFVFDINLKKWGKNVNDCKALLSLAPLTETNNAVVPYSNFGLDAGLLDLTGDIKLFTVDPADSFIRYGKIGFYRLGFTTALEVVAHFRLKCTGTMTISGSSDGRSIDSNLTYTTTFTDATECVGYPDVSARWFFIEISGEYDLTYLEFRGKMASRR